MSTNYSTTDRETAFSNREIFIIAAVMLAMLTGLMIFLCSDPMEIGQDATVKTEAKGEK